VKKKRSHLNHCRTVRKAHHSMTQQEPMCAHQKPTSQYCHELRKPTHSLSALPVSTGRFRPRSPSPFALLSPCGVHFSALRSDWRPFCKRPALTRIAPWRLTKGGRKSPAPRGLVRNGLLVYRLQGGLPPRPGRLGLSTLSREVSLPAKQTNEALKRSRWALAQQGQTCQRSERAFFLTRPQ
jgi:hypothetical protein